MRPTLRLALLAASLTLGADVARTETCPVPPSPSDLTAAIETTTYNNVTFRQVKLTWTEPPVPDLQTGNLQGFDAYLMKYRIERRYGTTGNFATIAKIAPSFGAKCGPVCTFSDTVRDADTPSSYCALGCVNPEFGPDVEYRVVVEYAFEETCAQDPQGRHFNNETAPSNVAHVDLPKPIVPPKTPENFRSVADEKKRSVALTWDKRADADRKGRYVVRRRKLESSTLKEDSAFVELVTLNPNATKYLDRNVLPDTEYEYDIAFRLDAVLSAVSAPNKSKVVGACPASRWKIWYGKWANLTLDYAIEFAPGSAILTANIRDTLGSGHIAAGPAGPARFGAQPQIKLRGKIVEESSLFHDDKIVPIAPGTKGTFVATMHREDPFDPLSWKLAALDADFGKGGRHEAIAIYEGESSTSVCATIGSGKAKLPGGVARPDQPVVFTIAIAALGPRPLYFGELQAEIEIEGGTIVAVGDEVRARHTGDPTGTTHAEFEIGALGPAGAAKSELGVITIAAAAPAGLLNKSQLVCTVTLVPKNAMVTAPVATRYVKVNVDPAPKPL